MLWWHLKENNVIKIKKINSIFELFFSLNFDNYINKLHKTFVSSV
jgi:hypothetical protein